MSEFTENLKREIDERLCELRPVINEYRLLGDMMEIIEYQKKSGKRSVTWDEIEEWFKMAYMPTDQFKIKDLAQQFDKSHGWAKARVERLLEKGLLEQYGNGLLRRPAINLGQKMTLKPGG